MSENSHIPTLKSTEMPKRGSSKLIYWLIALFAILLIIIFFRSSLSKVDQVQISGAELVPVTAIKQAVQVEPGDSFFFVRSQTIVHRVKALKTIKSVKVSKIFPGIIRVAVIEYPRVAFQIDENGNEQALLADGSAVSLKGLSIPVDKPILTNWKSDDPVKSQLCAVLAQIPAVLLSDVSEIVPNPSAAYIDKIKLYTRSDFEVDTTVSFLLKNIPYLSSLVSDMKNKENIDSGILSLLDSPYGKPFASSQDNQTAAPGSSNGTSDAKSGKTTPKRTAARTPKPTPTPTSTPARRPVITARPAG